jgi:hypothetical protein
VRELTAFGGPVVLGVDEAHQDLLVWAATELQLLSVQWAAGDPEGDGTAADGGDRGLAGDLVVTGLLTRGARDAGAWFPAAPQIRRRVDLRDRVQHDVTAVVHVDGTRIAWSTQRPPKAREVDGLGAVGVDGREGWRCERLAAVAAELDLHSAREFLAEQGATGWLMTSDGIVWPIDRNLGPVDADDLR